MGELLDLSLEILTVCQCKRGIERLGRTFKIFNRPEVEMLEKLTKKLAVFAWPVLEYTKRGMVKGQSNRWSLILESYDKKKARKSGTEICGDPEKKMAWSIVVSAKDIF
ncbi:Protein of unknown function [Pyronema omphalodes CBS 100304]|uniref:Uncharacterized protein n=1 Tax=Pyronema omphalodes (strain CBS 100304) TaxID=1076935 RepID=U4LPA6_PYROM|nr:Protein of unknown function [Pyronema omphalodes CBS 100304]